MRYAFWNLKNQDENYLIGPEKAIKDAGGSAKASWSDGQVENGATILGYVNGDFDLDLSAWNYREVSQEEALTFAQAIDSNAFIGDDGQINTILTSV